MAVTNCDMSKNTHIDKWKMIDAVAADMGVRPGTLRQWKNRGIPYWAHIKIVQATAGKVTADDLMETRK